MYRLNLPQYEIKIKQQNGKTLILDTLRRKFVSLTPEEWVRQHFVHFLTEHKGYPSSLIANETELTCGQKKTALRQRSIRLTGASAHDYGV